MPIYEFICQSCGNEFEKIQSFSATVAPPCPSCKADQVVRRLSRPAIHFKGSGWYINDSKTENKSNGKAESKPDGEASVSKSSDTAADSKSEKPEAPAKEAAPAPAEKAKESVA